MLREDAVLWKNVKPMERENVCLHFHTSTDNLGLSVEPSVDLGCGKKPGENQTCGDLLVCTPLCFYPQGAADLMRSPPKQQGQHRLLPKLVMFITASASQ